MDKEIMVDLVVLVFSVASIFIGVHAYKKQRKTKNENTPNDSLTEKMKQREAKKEKLLNDTLAGKTKIFIITRYLEGILSFKKNCDVMMELLPTELRINEIKWNKPLTPIHTASLPYPQIVNVDIVEIKRRGDVGIYKDIALASKWYFIINYISKDGVEEKLLFDKPSSGSKYSLFMQILKERASITTPTYPTHIDL